MAYINQETKKVKADALKPILKKYGVKATLAVRNNTTIVLTVREGPIEFNTYLRPEMRSILTRSYIDVNPYHYARQFEGVALDFLTEVFSVLNEGNWDKSNPASDYFNVGWYSDVTIGKWNKPYKVTVG
jgi:hypothetical protein